MMESVLFRHDYLEEIYPLSEADTLEGMMTLIRKCAVLCGPTSGANFTAALRYLKKVDATLDRPQKAVFIVCDRMEWYISYVRERMPELFGQQEKDTPLSSFDSTNIMIVPTISAGEIEKWKRDNAGGLIIDIRVPQSFNLVRIPGSLNMPQEQFAKWISGDLPFAEGASVLLVCAVGEQSRHYAAYLASREIKAFNLDGGIMTWHDLSAAA